MEEMKKEAWVAEFGERSVENPNVVDLIKVDPASGQVVLVMIERREWDNGPQQFSQIEEKINRYMGYVLDGHLTTHSVRRQACPDPSELCRGTFRQGRGLRDCGAARDSRAWPRVRRERHADSRSALITARSGALSTRHSSITRPYVRCRIASNSSPSARQNGPFNHGLLAARG